MVIQPKSGPKEAHNPEHLPEHLVESVERAVAELRRGGAVVIVAGEAPEGISAALVRAAETVDAWPPAFFDGPGIGAISLAVTGRRACILGLSQPDARAVQLNRARAFTADDVRALIDPQTENERIPPPGVTAATLPAHSAGEAAVLPSKIARLLPAVVIAPLANVTTREAVDAWACATERLIVNGAAIEAYERNHADDLRPISEARVPLADAADTRIISFRPSDGGTEHLAIVIGTPDPAQPVLARLHSECFTGDLLASLRCDCGDQLRGAVAAIAKEGGGVLLYLAQEGRGIGLVNKLRAYALQDQGFDTVDANEQLGFDDDERVYLPAVRMLRHLGYARVRLLTNNPAKVGALVRHGIDVTERVPHAFPSNSHNWTYLQTKAKRSGHLF